MHKPLRSLALLHRNLVQEIGTEWDRQSMSLEVRLQTIGGTHLPLTDVSVASVRLLRAVIDELQECRSDSSARRLDFSDSPETFAASARLVTAAFRCCLSQRHVRRVSAVVSAEKSRAVRLWTNDFAVLLEIEELERFKNEQRFHRDMRQFGLAKLRADLDGELNMVALTPLGSTHSVSSLSSAVPTPMHTRPSSASIVAPTVPRQTLREVDETEERHRFALVDNESYTYRTLTDAPVCAKMRRSSVSRCSESGSSFERRSPTGECSNGRSSS
jgi:hypothetical protein